MPTSRGSCSGSGVLLELALENRAPAALIFTSEDEMVLTLGAVIADRIFQRPVTVLRVSMECYRAMEAATNASIEDGWLSIDDVEPGNARRRRWKMLEQRDSGNGYTSLRLNSSDEAILNGAHGVAARQAMEVVVTMAIAQGAKELRSVSRGHVDGCILAHAANLIFAEHMRDLGAKVIIPTTINAISVDRENWRAQGVDEDFGSRASRLADAYVDVGCTRTFTCAPYLLDESELPARHEDIAWSESNAVFYANTVLGCRTEKLPDYLDLCIAMTGRAPCTGMYTSAGRAPHRVLRIDVSSPSARKERNRRRSCDGSVRDEDEDEDDDNGSISGGTDDDDDDDAMWPLIGWLAGKLSPDRIPLLRGLEGYVMTSDNLKNLCAAFGTTSGAPMLHIRGHTPEAESVRIAAGADRCSITRADLHQAWHELNMNFWLRHSDVHVRRVDLVAVGSPHASLTEMRKIVELLDGRVCHRETQTIVCVGRAVLRKAMLEGVAAKLDAAGVRVIQDLCWCSITTPYFPDDARVVLTSSGKYAHYGNGLCGRDMMFASMATCVEAMVSGVIHRGDPMPFS